MLNHSIESAKYYRQQMIDAGFVNVQERLYKWPINAWPKDVRYKEIGAFFSSPSTLPTKTLSPVGWHVVGLCNAVQWC
jgi:hypothetical protein